MERHSPQICLEFSHTYVPERLVPLTSSGDWSFDQASIAAERATIDDVETSVRDRFNLEAEQITRVSLLDDVAFRRQQATNQDPGRLGLFFHASYQSVATVFGPQNVYLESSYESVGRELQDQIRRAAIEHGYPIDSQKVTISTNRGSVQVRIAGFDGHDDPSLPSCAVLDLAWTRHRVEAFSKTFTVLPLSYRNQQRQVAALAALLNLPRRESVVSVFVDSKRQVVDELGFGTITLIAR
ncbi:MAG: hypothetical protein J0M12_12495 [Deltaproteobacteria bacterium]|nr:hypothetical protein [Deltaproteobacteria bacterium]